MDYAFPSKRKTKGDWKAKARFNKYKKGGSNRSNSINLGKSQRSEN